MYFLEGYYLYTQVGSSGRGERTSEKGVTSAPEWHVGHLKGKPLGRCDYGRLYDNYSLIIYGFTINLISGTR